MDDVGIVVCSQGSFVFNCEGMECVVNGGETLFLSRGVCFSIVSYSADCQVAVIMYSADSIRDILGNTVVGMRFMEMLHPVACRVMHTGHEAELTKYSELLAAGNDSDNVFAANECRLLLLALTYRVCSIFHNLSADAEGSPSRSLQIYMQLQHLINAHYSNERGVQFYADRLCLSPKYLTTLVKTVSGSTVQQLVFKEITKRAIALITTTDKSIKQIAHELNFPNSSAFGTFFKKQVGMSPINYRKIYK